MAGVNSVTIGTCTMGQITVSANITFPSNAEMKVQTAIIINNAGAPVTALFPLMLVSGDDYVGTVNAVPPGGPYKAKVFASWKVPDGDDKTSATSSTCPMPVPPPPPPPLPPPPPPPPPVPATTQKPSTGNKKKSGR